MLLVLAFLPLALAAFLVGELATAPQRRRSLAIKRAGTYGARRGQAETVLPRFSERVVAPAVERLAAIALRLNPKASVDAIGTRLIAAGLAQRVSTSQFLAVKAGLALTGLLSSTGDVQTRDGSISPNTWAMQHMVLRSAKFGDRPAGFQDGCKYPDPVTGLYTKQ